MTPIHRPRDAGFTLIEILIAVSLVALLSVAMLVAIRVGLNAEIKANSRLDANRRVVGAQRALEQELNGFMPEVAIWSQPDGGGLRKVPFFEGTPQSMRLVSSYSLNEASRGAPKVLEFLVVAGDQGQGVRLIVDELPYRGGGSTGSRIAGFEADVAGIAHPVFYPISVGAGSFVLADHLASCHFVYLAQEQNPPRHEWRDVWIQRDWPLAVRVEMVPLQADVALLHPITVTAAFHSFRDPDKSYGDQPGLK